MRRRRYEYSMPRPRRRKKRGTMIALLLVAAALVYIYFSHGGALNSIFSGINVTTNVLGTEIQSCNQKVADCGNVINAKYESNLTILKSSELNTTLGANNFLGTWGASGQIKDIGYYDTGLPVVMVAARMDNPDGTKTPHVFICRPDGSLDEKSISGLC